LSRRGEGLLRLKGMSMTARPLPIAGSIALALVLAGCSIAGIKPAPGNRSASAAIASFAPVAATPAGHVPKAAAVPPAPGTMLVGYAGSERGALDGLIAHNARHYDVPEHLVRRVIMRDSG